MSDVGTVKGIVDIKDKKISDNPKAPAGRIKLENADDFYTCWDKDVFNSVNKGDEVEINYQRKTTAFGTNFNILDMSVLDKNTKVLVKSKPGRPIIQSIDGLLNIGGKYYKISKLELEEVDEVK